MASDWAADVKKYAPNADDGVIAGVVRYCGIALRKVDSSLVAFSDKKETDRVRDNFLKKKLGLTQADKTLDAAIAKVGEAMKADRTKNRVTVYYLLADNFKKLDLFAPKAKAPAKAAKPAAKAPAKSGGKAAAAAALVGAAGAATAKAPARKAAAPAKKTVTEAKKPAAPAKKAAAVTTAKKAPTKKVAIKAAPAPQGLLDKAAGAGTAAVAGTMAAAGAVAATTASAASNAANAAKDTAAKAVDVAGNVAGAVTGAAGAAVTGAAGLASGAADKAGSAVSGAVSQLSGTDEDAGLGWLWWVIGLALLLFAIWYFFLRNPGDEAAAPAPAPIEAATPAAAAPADLTAAPAEGTVEIPAGAGVTSELRDAKPVVKVYFDTGKTDLAPAFGGAAGGLKAWLEANPGSSLAISGYSDPSGNAAANAELAKNRAQAVQVALVGTGIAETAALLVKPEVTADATVPAEAARRVEVVVR